MYPISDACAKALAGDHTSTVVCEVYEGFGRMLTSTYQKGGLEIDTSNGQIQIEHQAVHSRNLQCTVVDESGLLVPDVDQTVLDPVYRQQAQFYFKIGWVDDLGQHYETIPVGRFMLDRNLVKETGGQGVTMEMSGNSRSSTSIQDNAWLRPYQMSSGETWDSAIQLALTDRTLPGWDQQFIFESSQTIMPLGVQLLPDDSSNPWADLQAMAVSDAKELLEDALGAFILRTPPDLRKLTADDSVWKYTETKDSPSHELGSTRDIDITKARNGAIVNGSAPWLLSPIQGVAWDDDPGSPTYYLGTFGRRAQTFSDDTIGSADQANAVAAQKLSTVLGVSEQVSFDSLPNPAHEPGDVVTLQFSASRVSDIVVLQSLTLPFSVATPMSAKINRIRR